MTRAGNIPLRMPRGAVFKWISTFRCIVAAVVVFVVSMTLQAFCLAVSPSLSRADCIARYPGAGLIYLLAGAEGKGEAQVTLR